MRTPRLPKVFDALDLPQEALFGLPQLLLEGNHRLRLENHQGVLEYGAGFLRIKTNIGVLRVEGEGLVIKELNPQVLIVEGELRAFAFAQSVTEG